MRMTTLGHFQPISLGGGKFVVLPLRHPAREHDADKAIGELSARLTELAPIRWEPVVPPEPFQPGTYKPHPMGPIVSLLDQESLRRQTPPFRTRLASARTIEEFLMVFRAALPPTTVVGVAGASGELYFGAGFGQVRRRDAEGHWSSLDTGAFDDVRCVAWHARRLLVGTAGGRLMAGADDGTGWATVARFAIEEVVVDIDRSATGWIVVTLAVPPIKDGKLSDGKVKVYAADEGLATGFRLLHELVFPKDGVQFNVPAPHGELVAGQYYLASYPKLYRVDLAGREFAEIKLPIEGVMFGVSTTTDMFTIFKPKGASSKLFVSSDRGQSWKKLDAPPYVVQLVAFDSLEVGWAWRMRPDFLTATLEFLRYDLKGDDWRRELEAPPGFGHCISGPDRRLVACVTNGGSVLRPDGIGWQVEVAAE